MHAHVPDCLDELQLQSVLGPLGLKLEQPFRRFEWTPNSDS